MLTAAWVGIAVLLVTTLVQSKLSGVKTVNVQGATLLIKQGLKIIKTPPLY